MEDTGEKTEQPTLRKREEARQRGQVAKSTDLSTSVILLASLLGLRFFGGLIWDGLSTMTINIYSNLDDAHLEKTDVVKSVLLATCVTTNGHHNS